jgi:hypothetical protein
VPHKEQRMSALEWLAAIFMVVAILTLVGVYVYVNQ